MKITVINSLINILSAIVFVLLVLDDEKCDFVCLKISITKYIYIINYINILNIKLFFS